MEDIRIRLFAAAQAIGEETVFAKAAQIVMYDAADQIVRLRGLLREAKRSWWDPERDDFDDDIKLAEAIEAATAGPT